MFTFMTILHILYIFRKLSHKLAFAERDLEHAELRETAANQHLNKVLAIAEQTAAERDSYEKMVRIKCSIGISR